MAKEKNKTVVLLDVHAIIHRAYHALPEFATSAGVPTGALYGLSTMLLKIIGDMKPDYIFACYDLPKPTYRHEAYKDYKAGRAKTDEALVSQLKQSYEIFKAMDIPVYSLEGFEADDMVGTLTTKLLKEKNMDVVIASGDMDTLQLVVGDKVRVYTLKKGIKDTIIYNEEGVLARYGFMPKFLVDYKGLCGDQSDNIKGVPGIGEKTATTLIQNFGSVEDIYKKLKKDKEAFKKVGLTDRVVKLLEDNKDEAEFSKMLGTIRRDAPIEFTLPAKHWSETLDIAKIKDLWTKLEFRTLEARLREVLSGEKLPVTKASQEEIALPSMDGINPLEFRETATCLWLLNSSLTNPTLEDVLNFSHKSSFSEAREAILAEIEAKHLTKVWEDIEKPLLPIVDEMYNVGIAVDKKVLTDLGEKYHKVVAGLEKHIHDLAGREFNISSPKQLGEVLFTDLGLKAKNQKKTGSGQLSTKESELEKLKDLHSIIGPILEYRELTKLLGTYIDTIPTMVSPDGRLRARFIPAGSTTGRMASADPNLQNIPNKTDLGREIRKAFVAKPGSKLLALDYSQMELRIAAFLSGDKQLVKIFKDGADVHTAVAAAVFNVPLENVDKEMRRRAKVINFGIMYGMGVNALKVNLGTDRVEAQKFYDEYFAKFDGLAKYLDEIKAEATRLGYTETFFGRRRYFEGLKSKLPFMRAMAERMAINAPIQGTEADVIKIAMVKVAEYLKKEKLTDKVSLLLQVHDELVFECEDKLLEEVVPEIKKIMESVIHPDKALGISLLTEASIGDNWGEMKKLH